MELLQKQEVVMIKIKKAKNLKELEDMVQIKQDTEVKRRKDTVRIKDRPN